MTHQDGFETVSRSFDFDSSSNELWLNVVRALRDAAGIVYDDYDTVKREVTDYFAMEETDLAGVLRNPHPRHL
jgi:hypothetical protein